jgi:hypothetical protein
MGGHDRDLEIQSLRGQLTLISVAFFLMVGFQTFALIRDRITLTNVRVTQEPTIQQSLKVRQQLDALAKGVARLADAGNANAKNIIDDLRRQGITVNNPQAGVQQ